MLTDQAADSGAHADEAAVLKKKKKKKLRESEVQPAEEQGPEPAEEAAPIKAKRKKKRQVVFDEE